MSLLIVNFNSTSNNFELLDAEEKNPVAEFTYGYPWEPIPSTDGYMLQLWSSGLAESHVIQLINSSEAQEKSIGWLCTASALTSTQHDFSDNKYFRAAAGHAVQMLLEQDSVQAAIAKIDKPTIDIFPERVCIFIVKKSLFSVDFCNHPFKLYPQLHQYSFSPHLFGMQRTYLAGKHAVSNLSPAGIRIKKLRIKSISGSVPFFDFIESLLSESLPTKQDPPYRFFLYYQIIELLMEEVQRHKQMNFVQNLNNANGDPTQLYDLIQTLGEQTNEQARIIALFHYYTKIPSGEIDGLKNECLSFLDHMQRRGDIKDCGKALYKVRNILIHNMRRIPSCAYVSLSLINEYLEVIVPSMLLTFFLPMPEIQAVVPATDNN